jgi:uncharacterized protein DUF3311
VSQQARWAIVVVLLIPPVVLPLLVGVYDRTDPELFGFPFYYWFQFALIPVAAALTTAAFLLTRGERPPADEAEDHSEAIR